MKKMVLIALVAVLALSTVGFGFARWTSTVNGNVQVQTGKLIIGIKDLGTNDDAAMNKDLKYLKDDAAVNTLYQTTMGTLGADPNYGKAFVDQAKINEEHKNVGSLTSYNLGCVPLTDAAGNAYPGYYKTISEVLLNGYPWYSPTTEIAVTNLGTIPVKLNNVQIGWQAKDANGKALNDLGPWVDLSYTITVPATSPFAGGSTTLSGSGLDSLQADIKKVQLHEKDSAIFDITFGLRETDSVTGAYANPETGTQLPMNATGVVSFSVDGTQWNEVQ